MEWWDESDEEGQQWRSGLARLYVRMGGYILVEKEAPEGPEAELKVDQGFRWVRRGLREEAATRSGRVAHPRSVGVHRA